MTGHTTDSHDFDVAWLAGLLDNPTFTSVRFDHPPEIRWHADAHNGEGAQRLGEVLDGLGVAHTLTCHEGTGSLSRDAWYLRVCGTDDVVRLILAIEGFSSWMRSHWQYALREIPR